MKKFKVIVNWSGYSRGVSVWEVAADDKDGARNNYYEGEEVSRDTIRDDTESDVESVEEIKTEQWWENKIREDLKE